MEHRTLAQLRADVRFLGDVESLTARHPDADLTRRLNAAIREYRSLVTANGGAYFVEQTTAATLAGTRVTGEQYSEVPFPAGPPRAVEILGVDVASSTSADDWYSLQPVTWAARRDWRWSTPGSPRYFAIRRLPTTDPADLAAILAGAIDIFPFADVGAYKISYLPDWTDLSADADHFLALPGGVQFVVATVVQDLAMRDDDQRETYQIASLKKAEASARLIEAVSRVRSAGPLLPRRRRRRFGR